MRLVKLFFFYIGYVFSFRTKYLDYVYQLLYGGFIARKINVKRRDKFLCDGHVVIAGGKYITIESGHIKDHCRLEAVYKNTPPHIKIGKSFMLGSFSHIGICSELVIGDNFLSGANVLITDHTHGYDTIKEGNVAPSIRELKVKGNILIGNNVFMGDNVVVLGGVTIGDNVTIGASTIVTRDVPANSIVIGCPQKVRNKE